MPIRTRCQQGHRPGAAPGSPRTIRPTSPSSTKAVAFRPRGEDGVQSLPADPAGSDDEERHGVHPAGRMDPWDVIGAVLLGFAIVWTMISAATGARCPVLGSSSR